MSVCVLERRARRRRRRGHRGIPSRAFATRPRATRSACSHPQVIRDLELARARPRGRRAAVRELPAAVARPATTSRSAAASRRRRREVARFSRARRRRAARATTRCSTAWPPCCATCCWSRRPTLGGGIRARPARRRCEGRRRRFRALDLAGQRDVLDLFTKSAGDVLDRWFESRRSRPRSASTPSSATSRAPTRPGSAYVLLHHVFGEVNGKRGAVGTRHRRHGRDHAGDGEGVRGARRDDPHGRAGRARASSRRGRAAGVELESRRGRSRAARVVANVNPKLLFERLVAAGASRRRTSARASRRTRCGSGTFRMNVALSELPDFTACPDDAGRTIASGIIMAPSLAYMERAYFDARTSGWSREPIVEMLIPSTRRRHARAAGHARREPLLPARAPRPRRGAPGRSWDDAREEVADLMIDTVDALRAELPRERARPAGALAARPRARVRPHRRRHLPRRADARPALHRAAGARPRQLPHARSRPLPVRRRARIPAAA